MIEDTELSDYLQNPATFDITFEFQVVDTAEDEDGKSAGDSLLISTVVESLIKIKRHRGIKESSIKTYLEHYAHFERTYTHLPLQQETVLEYLGQFDGKTGRTKLNRQAELSMLYAHASDKFGVFNPIAGLPRPKIKRLPISSLTLDQVRAMDSLPMKERERTALDLLLGHGWRQVEVRRITAEDVRGIHDGLIWVRGKERDEYTPILPETQTRLEAMASDHESDERVFRGRTGADLKESGMAKLIAGLYKRAGIVGFRGHDLRRTFATIVTESSRDELLAMRLLRDQVPLLNSRYINIAPDRLLGSLLQYSPLRLIKPDSPSIHTGELMTKTGESMVETGELMVETGESRTPRPEEAAQNMLQA